MRWNIPHSAFFLLTVLATSVGLGRHSYAKPVDLAVLPTSAVNVGSEENDRLIGLLAKRLRAHPSLRVKHSSKDVTALALSLNEKCHEENTCLSELGRKLQVARLLLFRSGRLGETLLLRLLDAMLRK